MVAWGLLGSRLSVWLCLYSLYEHSCTTRGSLFLTLQHEVHWPVRRSYPYHRRRPHNTRPEQNPQSTCDLLPACLVLLRYLCSDAYGMSWNHNSQSHRVRLIPHLSSPLLEPPVKVGSQGVLAVQLTAIGTHALQAVGPQDWPMALYTIFGRTFGLPFHTANVQLPRHGPTSSLFSQAHSARSGRSQASLLPTIPI